MRITKNYCVLSIILIVISLFSSLAFQPAFSATEQAQSRSYDYVIFTNATSTYAKNGITGAIVYQNSNVTTLFASIPQGTSWYISAGRYVGFLAINQSGTSITGSGIDLTIIECPVGINRNCIQAGNEQAMINTIYIGNLTVNARWMSINQ